MQPTMTSTPAVAALGTAETIGAKKIDSAKKHETNTEVRPVRPPAAMPADDSTYVVVFDVPQIAPIYVATESAKSA